MAPFPSPCLHLQFFPTPPPFSLAPHPLPSRPFPSLSPLSASPSSPFPFSLPSNFKSPNPNPNPNPQFDFQPDNEGLGDCLVFDDDAFEDSPTLATSSPPLPHQSESLIPSKWREAVEELKLTKKERRKISHQLRFGSKMEGRKKSPMPSVEEYEAFKALKLSQVKPLVLDEPEGFGEEKEKEEERGEGRVVPRNPRVGLGKGGLEDIKELFSSGGYVPGENLDCDGKSRVGPRKLFTQEEKALLNKRVPNLEGAASMKWLPLHTLAASGEFYLLDSLLKHNVDINAVDEDGLTATHKAILCKKQSIINYLLRSSANPFIRDRDGATLIHYAVQTASSQTVKILLLYNVDINLADNYGWTPLHLAVQTRRTDIVKLLLIKGADISLKNQDGLTPLDLCLYSGHDMRTYELIKLLKGRRASRSTP